MANSISTNPNRVLDANGDPVPGAKAYFYQSGTTTPVTVYSDQACTIPHPTPLEADGNGVFPAFYPASAAAMKVDVTTALGAAVPGYPIDPVVITSPTSTGAASVSFSPTVEIPVTNVQAAIETVQGHIDNLGVTATGAALISASDAASARTTIGAAQAGNITTTDIAPATLVTASETIGSNNNDTTIPTSAAVKAYADGAVSAITTMDLLGTLTTTSGTTQTLSGLTLTPYRGLLIVTDAVSFGATVALTLGGVAVSAALASATEGFYGSMWLDLATGVVSANLAAITTGSASSGGNATPRTGKTSYSTATTSISFAGGTFDAGTIRVYGVK